VRNVPGAKAALVVVAVTGSHRADAPERLEEPYRHNEVTTCMSDTRTPRPSAPGTPGSDRAVDVDIFLRRFLAHAGSQLPGRATIALQAMARSALEFGRVRPRGQTITRLVRVDGETAALEIVTDDAPYLVDSVRAELERSGHPVERLLHPQLVVTRDDAGVLSTVYDLDDNADVPGGANPESWMHVEVDVQAASDADAMRADIERVLADVHYAVDDATETYARIRSLAAELEAHPGHFDADSSTEAGSLLRWLADGNFMILGHAAYSANELASPGRVAAPTEVQGVLRGTATISPLELLPAFRSGAPLVIFKSPLVSTVRRSARYDCVTVVTPATGTEGQTIHVFLGLITNAEDGNVARVPLVRKRFSEILQRSGVRANSHTGRQLLAALRTLPRDELLEAPATDLLRLAQLLVDRAEGRQVGVFARIHLNRDFVSVLVYFHADRFGPETRREVRATVLAHWPGVLAARDDRIVEMGPTNLARMHFLIALPPGAPPPSPDRHAVEAEVARVTRRWSDDLADLLTIARDEESRERLARRYLGAFPEAYKEDFSAATAVRDLARLEELDARAEHAEDGGAETFDVYVPAPDDEADRRLKVYRSGAPLSLARALPIFTQMGIEVLDERPYELDRRDGTKVWIYDFGLKLPAGVDLDEATTAKVLDALPLLWRGEIEQDGFNALVPLVGLTWWQTNVLRAYAKYLRQAGTAFSQGYIEQAMIDNAPIARRLVELFEARFHPGQAGTVQVVPPQDDRTAPVERRASILEALETELASVASLDQDRIIRSILELIRATLRTNAYRHDEQGVRRPALAFKLDPGRIRDLPEPRPRYEIWVYSPRVEGVHLRFGLIARGGLRWSDRREDFRTEVLGLVKAQMVKNAVIVPVGAKGGFVAKRLPDPQTDRDAWLAEGVACYRAFISCLLDVTDNHVTVEGRRRVEPPPRTRRYDGDDPYLVVAADKGTATFSDIANKIAAEYDFWLGDAFASGGSVGYDHKAMGITARGAWESVKYHFRELGVDVQTQDFTVVGIGDMSGDVFGNGMLLSPHIRLVAAFDHRHVFLDPDPDPVPSFAERQRLFALPGSSWADYDTTLISEGGGVYPRSLKAIALTDPLRRALALDETVETLTPAELIHAILVAPVDLLWNGGIGTYVKASSEPHLAAGDKANDAVRADAAQLRARVVGEGGNLGFTQLGRIEYARGGGHINTDAIDNSAGVDTSDHEVNLKILLDRVVDAGELSRSARNELLAAVTDDVAAHVLRDNYGQNVMLGLARRIAPQMVSVHGRLITALEESGELDRRLEFLPTGRELAQRAAAGLGLTSPELAVLAAYVKITLTQRIEDSTLSDEPWFQSVLSAYFPSPIATRSASSLAVHPLHREIITTVVVNDMVNRGGITFVHRAAEETAADAAQIARAYTISGRVFGLQELWDDIEALDNQVPIEAQHAAYRELRRLLDRTTRWLIDVRFPITDVAAEIARFSPAVRPLIGQVPELLCGVEVENLRSETDRLVGLGLPRQLAGRVAEMLNAFLLLDVVEIAAANGLPTDDVEGVARVADLHFLLSERFSVDDLLTCITNLPRGDRWSALARAALRHDTYAALSSITASVLNSTDAGLSADKRMSEWEHQNPERVARARATLHEALSRDQVDLATLSVALRMLRGLPA
jgi:glutamate dehydrogenase